MCFFGSLLQGPGDLLIFKPNPKSAPAGGGHCRLDVHEGPEKIGLSPSVILRGSFKGSFEGFCKGFTGFRVLGSMYPNSICFGPNVPI